MIHLWLAVGLLAVAGEPVPPAVDHPTFAAWDNYRRTERKRRELIEEVAREKLEEALPDVAQEDREDYNRRLEALLQTFTFEPMPKAGPEVVEIANQIVASLIADAEAEFDRIVSAMIRERDDRDAIATIMLCV